MVRDVSQLTTEPFDLAVIGGGVYGVCAAWRGALNGLRVCLVERHDFGSATSSNSLKVIHGGLRYLQHLDFRRMRESIRERNMLIRIAPHLVAPMPFVIPTYGHGVKGREAHALALRLNDLVAWDRNRGLDPGRQLPQSRMLDRAEVLERFPGIRRDGLSGGAQWYDGLSYNSERLLLAFLRSALRAGAVVANYVEVAGCLERDGAVVGLKARDELTGRELSIRSRMVLNTAGPWVDNILAGLSDTPETRVFHLSKAINLVTRQLIPDVAVGLQGPATFRDADAAINKGFRMFFIIPWRSYSLIGTRHFPYDGAPDDMTVSNEEIRSFLNEINSAYPPARLQPADIVGVYSGMLPRDPDSLLTNDVQLEKHCTVIDHEREHGIPGVMTVVGVKWTTARLVAFETVDRITRKLGRESDGPCTAPPSLAGSPGRNLAGFLEAGIEASPSEVTPESAEHVLLCYGTESDDVFGIVREDPSLGQRLLEESPVIGAQIVHGARSEMAQHLDDVVLRRTELGTALELDEDTLQKCADLVGRNLGWRKSTVIRELDRTRKALGVFRLRD
jgi:glycerol-3-phosphate dehydrogenase